MPCSPSRGFKILDHHGLVLDPTHHWTLINPTQKKIWILHYYCYVRGSCQPVCAILDDCIRFPFWTFWRRSKASKYGECSFVSTGESVDGSKV